MATRRPLMAVQKREGDAGQIDELRVDVPLLRVWRAGSALQVNHHSKIAESRVNLTAKVGCAERPATPKPIAAILLAVDEENCAGPETAAISISFWPETDLQRLEI
jgi:hypothetical protein